MRDELAKTRNLHNSVQRTLSKLETRISRQSRKLHRLAQKLRASRKKLARLKKDRRRQEQKLATQRTLLGKQIRSAFMIGRQEYLKLILNQEDPALFGRTLVYYDYFNQARSEQISQVQVALEKIEKLDARIRLASKKLRQTRATQQAEKKALEKTYRARALVLARLGREIKTKGQRLAQMSADEKRLEDLLQAINKAMPDIFAEVDRQKPFAAYRGKLMWPVRGKLKRLFGKHRKAGKLKWNGDMIMAAKGREVHAISHGRVAYADWLRGYGLLLIIDHGDGYMSLYGHNQSLYMETGDWVDANEVIGEVGDSGGQQRSGLYFEIRYKGKPTNPGRWCKRMRHS
ncbi:Murein hydrolase activator EnvC [hydrothermal vent metagenome]|uniref:Murein hydrolase activator EnvC n=1 Tax=hydrothermal vent metagenome TaxID=652676 RepID=A0A3B1CAJ2_9ZZZZ